MVEFERNDSYYIELWNKTGRHTLKIVNVGFLNSRNQIKKNQIKEI